MPFVCNLGYVLLNLRGKLFLTRALWPREAALADLIFSAGPLYLFVVRTLFDPLGDSQGYSLHFSDFPA